MGGSIAVDLGATDYNYDVNNTANYALNEFYTWKVLVNFNINNVQFFADAFNTESGYDYIALISAYGSMKFTGNLGGFAYTAPPLLQVARYWITWRSDYTINRPGLPKINRIRPYCTTSPQPTIANTAFSTNERYDGILIATGDIIYTTMVQDPNTELRITATVVAATPVNSDFDLYVSTTALPNDSNYQWRDYSGNSTGDISGAGGALRIPATTSARTLYIGVHSYSGAGHFVLRADEAKQGALTNSLIVCTPGQNLAASPNLSKVLETIQKTLLRMQGITHGNYQPNGIIFKQIEDNHDKYCSNDTSCQVCMSSLLVSSGDPCNIGQSQTGGVSRVPNDTCSNYNNPDWQSQITAHELGHGRFYLPDEYNWKPNGQQSDWFCGHSIENMPTAQSDKWCVTFNHCKDQGATSGGPPSGFDCSATGTNWAIAQAHYPTGFVTTVPPDLVEWSSQPARLLYRNVQARSLYPNSFQ